MMTDLLMMYALILYHEEDLSTESQMRSYVKIMSTEL